MDLCMVKRCQPLITFRPFRSLDQSHEIWSIPFWKVMSIRIVAQVRAVQSTTTKKLEISTISKMIRFRFSYLFQWVNSFHIYSTCSALHFTLQQARRKKKLGRNTNQWKAIAWVITKNPQKMYYFRFDSDRIDNETKMTIFGTSETNGWFYHNKIWYVLTHDT